MLEKIALLLATLTLIPFQQNLAATTLLNASYDVTREFYSEYNPLFAQHWRGKTGEEIAVNQSHGGSTKQARAVIDGLDADVVTMNQPTDIDALAEKPGLVDKDWRPSFPNDRAPYRSTIVFLVRKGNPKGIKDWDDLTKPDISPIIPNPKTSGNGRYSYLGAWGFAKQKY
ncbi:MAG: sulfate ABC transporter substrate-binding protein, partial [Methylococcaceae bacterium]|nr:sulfate ABC transporter substrate-binding protein [Methylococcaceae bacterium]